jgi:tRNA pseudouridine38-40 synthase
VAGRTDAGVHARGQVASFPAGVDADVAKLQRSLNAMLAPEIVVRAATLAGDGFDARFSASAREYRYRIDTSPWPNPVESRFVWHRQGRLSPRRMRAAARGLVGEHDFAAFCRRPQDDAPTVRRLERLSVAMAADRIEIGARANAFLHQMVRSLVGTLVACGEGGLSPEEVPAILSSRDRSRAGQLAPPHGLTLERVVYGRR